MLLDALALEIALLEGHFQGGDGPDGIDLYLYEFALEYAVADGQQVVFEQLLEGFGLFETPAQPALETFAEPLALVLLLGLLAVVPLAVVAGDEAALLVAGREQLLLGTGLLHNLLQVGLLKPFPRLVLPLLFLLPPLLLRPQRAHQLALADMLDYLLRGFFEDDGPRLVSAFGLAAGDDVLLAGVVLARVGLGPAARFVLQVVLRLVDRLAEIFGGVGLFEYGAAVLGLELGDFGLEVDVAGSGVVGEVGVEGVLEQFAHGGQFVLGDGVVDLALEALALHQLQQISFHVTVYNNCKSQLTL